MFSSAKSEDSKPREVPQGGHILHLPTPESRSLLRNFNLSYHNSETTFFAIDPDYANLLD